MQHVFWVIGREGSGKSTLLKQIEKHHTLDFEIEILDMDYIVTQLGGIEYRKKNVIEFMKRLVKLVEISAKKNKVVIVGLVAPRQEFRDIPREFFGSNFHEIYLKCSTIRGTLRKPKNNLRKVLRRLVMQNYDIPQSADLIIDTSKFTIEQTQRMAIDFISKTVNEN